VGSIARQIAGPTTGDSPAGEALIILVAEAMVRALHIAGHPDQQTKSTRTASAPPAEPTRASQGDQLGRAPRQFEAVVERVRKLGATT
jgi:hypothetical protein